MFFFPIPIYLPNLFPGNAGAHTGEDNKLEASLFNNTSSSDSLHTVKKPQFSYGFTSSAASVPVSSSASSLQSSSLGNGFPHTVSKTEQFAPVFGTSTSDSVAEDWGKYSSNSISTSNPLEGVHFPTIDSSKENDDWGDFSAGAGIVEDENWCDFNSEAEDGGNRESDNNFVTIKKQNLGTNEILGLFKVRDDPTTLSSYQLPQQQLQPTNKTRCELDQSLCLLFIFKVWLSIIHIDLQFVALSSTGRILSPMLLKMFQLF